VEEVLGLVGLADVAGKRSKGFSLGMSQRLGIAAALLGDPGTVMFDEPVNGLDPEGIVWIRTLMRSLAAEGRTVFVSPGAHHSRRLRHVDRGDPLQDLLVLLVLDLLRFHHRDHLLAHQPSTQGERRPAGSRSETEKLTGVLVATVRDP
jgi:ABC-2 type transport system ATP-binding protein